MTIILNDENSKKCFRCEFEKSRDKFKESLRNCIFYNTILSPLFSQKSINGHMDNSSRIVVFEPETKSDEECPRNMIILEAGLPGDTWRYRVDRNKLAETSEWFRAFLVGPFAPEQSDPPPLVQLKHVEKRAFNHLLEYLYKRPIHFQSVSTARATLDAAHQYLYPGLAELAVEYLEKNLDASTVLEIYHGLGLYANDQVVYDVNKSPNISSAPPSPEDVAGEIAAVCTRLYIACLSVIDQEATTILLQESFEELNAHEIAILSCRDTLKLGNENILFCALNKWATSECRRQGIEPNPFNRRGVLSDDVWYSVRYSLMTDSQFINGPMKSGILSTEESAHICSKILRHDDHCKSNVFESKTIESSYRLSNTPRIGMKRIDPNLNQNEQEQRDNRKNRKKECIHQCQKTCGRIRNGIVRVFICLFD